MSARKKLLLPDYLYIQSTGCERFGERLRELRKDRGWRQLDLAEQAGISENYVSELELGQKEVCLRTIGVLSRALGVAIEEIVKDIQ